MKPGFEPSRHSNVVMDVAHSNTCMFKYLLYCADYCPAQYFVANCTDRGPNFVVLVLSAEYGRMRAGRCGTTESSGNIGCTVSMLWYFDRRCSGRRSCKVYIAEPIFHHIDPCLSDLKSYLEASYTCVKVSLSTSRSTPLQQGNASMLVKSLSTASTSS